MSTESNKNGQTIKTVADLAKFASADLVAFAVASMEQGRIAYLHAAKAIIVLTDKVGEKKATAELLAAGVKLHTIKNARFMVRVYDAAVRGNHASEEWFNGVHFTRAREFLEAHDKVGIKKLLEQKNLFNGSDASWTEITLIAESGKVKSERVAAAAKAATTEGATATEEGAEGAKTTEAKPANPLAEIESAMDSLEALLVAYAPKADEVAAEKINTRLPTLGQAWTDARATVNRSKKPAAKAANG